MDRFIEMKDISHAIIKATEELKRERDEIQLKLHLGKEELEDESCNHIKVYYELSKKTL